MKFINFEGEGKPIAIIKSANKRIKDKVISVSDKGHGVHRFNHLKLKDDDLFQLIPNPETERSIHYITGSSGSGKTYFIKQFLIEYKKVFPKNQIYLFSPFDMDDKSFEGIKLIPIKIDDELLTDKLTSKDFKDSMVVFDDIESIPDKALNKDVHRILTDILTTGRHYNVSACCVYHNCCNAAQTKAILNESHAITFFPRVLAGRSLKYLCDNYLGLEASEIKRLKKLKSRAVTVVKGYPRIVVSEKEVYCLGCDDSDSSDSDSSSSSSEKIVFKNKKKNK